MSIIIAIIIFSAIVLFHEFGHFLLAKLNGITVNEFALGMGPKLLSFEKGGTVYCLKALPFGGSCMMEGEDETSEHAGAFNNKSAWARISVVFAGPLFNFILAFVIAVILTVWTGFDAPVIMDIMEGYPAEAAGITAGDEIVSLNGKSIDIYREVLLYLSLHEGETLDVVYLHEGVRNEVVIEPKLSEDGRYLMGIIGGGYEKGTFGEAIKYGWYEVKYNVRMAIESLRMLVTGKLGLRDMSGPVGIVEFIDDTYQESQPSGFLVVLINMLSIAILLSANLGVMNLLPIPALDGGRLLLLIPEAITGKRIPEEKEGMINFVGFVFLMGLMVVVLFNDLLKIFM